jgi:hypothetical protein
MLQRNSVSRTFAGCFDRIPELAGGRVSTGGVALLALGLVRVMDAAGAAAIYAAALTLGGLLVADIPAVKSSTNDPSRCVVARERVRVRPLRNR